MRLYPPLSMSLRHQLSFMKVAMTRSSLPGPGKAIFLSITFFLASIAAVGSDFREGYVVLNSNDTITGLVDYVKSNSAYSSCYFKASDTINVIKYKPAEIKGYGFLFDKVFVSRDVQGNDEIQERVFLSVIISGLVTLYQLEDAFYLEKDDQSLHKLSNETYESIIDGKVILKNTNRHIAILNMLMPDLPQLQDEIKKIKLNEESLTGLVEKYNTFKGANNIIYKNRKPPGRRDAPSVESVISLESKDGYNHYESLWSKQKSSVSSPSPISFESPDPGSGADFNFLGGNISTMSKYPVYTLVNPFFPINRNYFTLSSNPLNNQLSSGRFSPYINAGMSGDNLSPDAGTSEFTRHPVGIDAFSRNPFLTGNQVGYWGGVGVSKPFASLSTYFELRYEQASGTPLSMMGYYSGMNPNTTNVQVVIGFKRR